MHAIASLLPVPTCTCGLTFSTAGLLSAHITASLGSSSSDATTPAAPASSPSAVPPATICTTSGCGHPYLAHHVSGPCQILLGAYGTSSSCPCRRFRS